MESEKLPVPIVIPTELKELNSQIEHWRSMRPRRTVMAEPLWILAANVVRQHGLARVARLFSLY